MEKKLYRKRLYQIKKINSYAYLVQWTEPTEETMVCKEVWQDELDDLIMHLEANGWERGYTIEEVDEAWLEYCKRAKNAWRL